MLASAAAGNATVRPGSRPVTAAHRSYRGSRSNSISQIGPYRAERANSTCQSPSSSSAAPSDEDLRDWNAQHGVVYRNVQVSVSTLYYAQEQTEDAKYDKVVGAFLSPDYLNAMTNTNTTEAQANRAAHVTKSELEELEMPILVAGINKLVFEPRSSYYGMWQTLMALSLSLIAVMTPLEVGVLQMDGNVPLDSINRVLELLFLMDLLITCRLGFFTNYSSEVLEVRVHEIQSRYLKSWFVVDLLAAVPWELFHPSVQGLSLLRLCKLANTSRFDTWMQYWIDWFGIENRKGSLVMYWMVVLLSGHWMACMWYYMMQMESQDQPHWISGQFPEHSWQNVSLSDAYPAGLNYGSLTMTTIGYGDVVAVNEEERWLSTLLQLLGAWIYTYAIAVSMMIVASMSRQEFDFNSTVDTLDDLAEDRGFPEDLTIRTKDYLQYSRTFEQSWTHIHLMSRMSVPLRAECSTEIVGLLKACPHFRLVGRGFQNQLVLRFQPETYPAGELIMRAGAIDSMIFVRSGVVSQYGAISPSGSVFGMEAIAENAKISKPVTAVTNVEIFRLSRRAIREVSGRFTHSARALRKAVIRVAFRRGLKGAIANLYGNQSKREPRSSVIMKKACEIKRKVAENKVIRAAKAKSQSHWDTLSSSLPQKSVQSVVQRVTLRPAQVDQWEKDLNMNELKDMVEKQRELIRMDNEIAETLSALGKIHTKVSTSYKDHSINPINCDFVRAVKRIHQIVNNDELIQEQERFWDSRQGLDFLVS